MKICIDADACPVTRIAEQVAKEHGIPVVLLCDTNHVLSSDYSEIRVIGAGADAVDIALINLCQRGDIVVTQDYGLASMCLAKKASVLHQDGWAYTECNIQALLFQRHESRKYRSSGGRVKGPRKRTKEQDKAFSAALETILQKAVQG